MAERTEHLPDIISIIIINALDYSGWLCQWQTHQIHQKRAAIRCIINVNYIFLRFAVTC